MQDLEPAASGSSDVKAVVLAYLRQKGDFASRSERDQLQCRYLEGGVLDSLGIVDMIGEFERVFAVQFSMDDLQSIEFQTPGGLIALVERLKSARGSCTR